MGKETRILCLTIVCTVLAAGIIMPVTPTVHAQEENIEDILSSQGFKEPRVALSGNEVLVEYKQPVSEFGPLSDEFRRIAIILTTVADELSPAYSVRIRQYFDDGQIMELVGNPEDGKAFLGNQISEETFSERLEFKPLTRGPAILPGVCEPDKGENCENSEDCVCYPNEFCDPTNPKANTKGCVINYIPSNSHLVGSEYVCDDGYEWNSDATGCVPEKICPANSFKFQGECYCIYGYEWNPDKTQCISKEETPRVFTGLTFESRSKSSGSAVQIPLTLKGIDENIGNMDITLDYDSSILEATEVIKGGLTTNFLFDYNIVDGTIKISLADKVGFGGDGSIAYVRFDVIGAEGSSSPLEITKLSTNRAEDLSFINIPTQDGVFRIVSMEEGLGDVDGDGIYTAVDALYALQMAVGKIPEDLIMDMNGDGSVTSLDASTILELSVRKS